MLYLLCYRVDRGRSFLWQGKSLHLGDEAKEGDMMLPLRIPLMLCLLCYRGDRGRSLLWWGKSLHLGDEAEEEGHEATTEDTFNVVLIVLQGRQRKIAPMMRKVTPSGWWGMRRRRDMRLPLRIPLMLYLLCYRVDRGRSFLWQGKSLHLGDEAKEGDMMLPLRIPLMLCLLCYRGDRGRSLLWWGKSLHLGDEAEEEGHEATTEDTFNVVLIVLQGRQRKIVSMTRKVTPSGDEAEEEGHEATTEDTFNVVLIVLQGRQRKITPMMRKVTPSGWWEMRWRRGDMVLPLRIPLMLCLLCYRGDRGRLLLRWGKSLHLGDEGWGGGGRRTWGYHWG